MLAPGELLETLTEVQGDSEPKDKTQTRTGLVVFNPLEKHELMEGKKLPIIIFNSDLPNYDVTKVLDFFDKYKIPRPALLHAIPKRISYHPNYSPQPPFDSSALLFFIAGMIEQIINCIYRAKSEMVNALEKQFEERLTSFRNRLRQHFWEMMIPGTNVFFLPSQSPFSEKFQPRIGEIFSGPLEMKIFASIETVMKEGKPTSNCVAAIPNNVIVAPRRGQEILEHFYSQKFWDFGQKKDVPEVDVLVMEAFHEILKNSGMTTGKPDTARTDAALRIPHQLKLETAKLVRQEGAQYASELSSRFESSAVRDSVRSQSFNAYYDWMLPEQEFPDFRMAMQQEIMNFMMERQFWHPR